MLRRSGITAWGLMAVGLGLLLSACGGGSGSGGGQPAGPRAHIQPLSNVNQFAGATWSFDGSGSSATGSIVAYRWDKDYDGTTFTFDASGVTANLSYTVSGTHIVALEVEDDQGATDLVTLSIQAWPATDGFHVFPDQPGSILDFGVSPVGVPVTRTVYLVNRTTTPVQFNAPNLSALPGLTSSGVTWPVTVQPTSDTSPPLAVRLVFTGNQVASLSGDLSFPTPAGAKIVPAVAVATEGFYPSGDLITGRAQHTATLLTDGRVLVVGGRGASQNELSSSEIYDPGTQTFSAGPYLNQVVSPYSPTAPNIGPRAFHSATRVSNGKVLVAGGQYQDAAQSNQSVAHHTVLVFDPSLNIWERSTTLWDPRTQHVAVWVNQPGYERVLLIGGKGNPNNPNDALATVDILLPNGNKEATGTLVRPRVAHAAVALPDGRVLIVGGQDPTDPTGATASAEVFDPFTRSSVEVQNLLPARTHLTLNAVYDPITVGTNIFAVGGKNSKSGAMPWVEQFAGISFNRPGASLLSPRYRHRAVELAGNKGLLIVGGYSSGNLAVGSAEILSPDGRGSVSAGGSMRVPRSSGHAATRLLDGSVLITGGVAPTIDAVKATERYLPTP
ncbi:MAG: PKD domain-containing protein [Nitrospirota bacterium]|nr:PKD domain-containing protein [Nitrospirota bacterium]